MTKNELLNVLTTLTNKLAAKIDSLFVRKETGKGLSTNDFTDDLKNKLDAIEGTGGNVTADEVLSTTSTNPIQNKVVTEALNNKADVEHIHIFADVLDKPTTLSGYGITDGETKGAANTALETAKEYTDQKIADLIDGAPTTLDTLNEIAEAISENTNVVDALDAVIGGKASTSDLSAHTNNSDVHITSEERTNWNEASFKKHTHSNAEVLDATTASFTTEEKEKLADLSVMEEITDDDIDAIIAGTFAD